MKILIAVDDTKGSKKVFTFGSNICACMQPDNVVLVYVEEFEGKSLITKMLGNAELETLEEVLEGTEYQRALDEKAEKILDNFKNALGNKGVKTVKTVIKKGHPAEEILKTAKKEEADMIIVGSRGKRVSHTFMGSVSREVVNGAEIPVLLVR